MDRACDIVIGRTYDAMAPGTLDRPPPSSCEALIGPE
jgi:hypothetical protein